MIVCITGWFDTYRGAVKTGKEFVVSHGIDSITGEMVILPSVHPYELGAVLDLRLNEFVIYDKGEVK